MFKRKLKKNIITKGTIEKIIAKSMTGIMLFSVMFVNTNSFAKGVVSVNEAKKLSSDVVSKTEELKKKYPSWNFEFVNTGFSFEEMVKMQFGEGRGLTNSLAPINLIESYGGTRYNEAWLDPARKHLAFDANQSQKRWQAPSIEAVRYFLDPRTYLNESDVFVFLSLHENNDKFDENKTKEMIKSALSGTKNATLDRIDSVYNAAKIVDLDVLELATKLRQEGGLEPNRGYDYYNPLNVGAMGNDPELAGLQYAQKNGWDTFEKGLIGGARLVKNNYIGAGQDTKYLMKFNVVNGTIYHQYMQNISAPLSEGKSLKSAYQKYDQNLTGKYTFKIPLFTNMPSSQSPRPRLENSLNDSMITIELLYLRSLPSSTKGERIRGLADGTEFQVLEEVTTGTDGIYSWYKVNVNGTVGYLAKYRLSNPGNMYFVTESKNNSNTDKNNEIDEKETVIKLPEPATQEVKEEVEYINNSKAYDQTVKLSGDYIYFAYDANLAQFVKDHKDIEAYENTGDINNFETSSSKKIQNTSDTQKVFRTGNIIVLNTNIVENGKNTKYTKKLKVIHKGDVTKDGKVSLDDLMEVFKVINNEKTFDELQKVASFVQIAYEKDSIKDQEVTVLNASNITYAIFDNINKKYGN